MRVAIIGQQAFGKSVLDAFVGRGDEVAGVFCAPEKEGARPDPLRLAAQQLGGNARERAGLIWYRTLTSGTVSPTADFRAFAQATVTAAEAEYGEESEEVDAVRTGWTGVGVLDDGSATT